MVNPARPAAKSVAELIGGSLDPLVRKRGLARAELIGWWPDIVGEAYAGRTVPERIKWGRDGRATLVVRCDPSLALQFSYETERVRERLNGYFGYPAVSTLRIVQHRVGGEEAAKEKAAAEPPFPESWDERLAGMDRPLGDALRTLGRRILARSP
jgi:hypothetical protein